MTGVARAVPRRPGGVLNPPPEEYVTFREFVDLRDRHVRDVGRLDTEKADAADVQELTKRVDALRGALITFALSVAGSAVVFALGTLALLWQFGGGGSP